MRSKLEVCIDSISGLEACINGKADRIELCSSLELGGLTPSDELMKLASEVNIPCRVMIRPKKGSFEYSSRDLHQMFDISHCAHMLLVLRHRLQRGFLH